MVYPLTLFPPNSTVFTTNGLGYLGDASSCVITEEANGSFELEMEYPIDGRHFSDITYRSIIFAKSNPYGTPQAFRIYKISKPMNGIVTYYAAHISYDLSGVTLKPWEANSCKEVFAGIPEHSVGLSNFTFWTNVEAEGYFWQLNPLTLRNALGGDEGCVLALYGGEYEFDNFEVKLYAHRGQNYGTKIIYGKNLTDITQEENCSNVYSAVYPYWANSSDETLITLPEETVPALGTHDFTNILTLDLSSELEDEPSDEELREAAKKYIEDNQIGVPSISIEVSFVQLEQTEEYKYLQAYEHIQLFDTVEVEFPKLGVSSTARVTTTVYDALTDRYTSITLGDSRVKASDTIADQGISANNSIKNVSVTVNQNIEASKNDLSGQITNAVDWLTNGKGNIQIVKDAAGQWTTLYILDNNGLAEAVNVLRFTKSGLEYSSTGIGGPWLSVLSQGGMLQAPRMNVTDTQQITGGTSASLQVFLDEIADRVATKLVTKSMMSKVNENDDNKVPTSSLLYSLASNVAKITCLDYLVVTDTDIETAKSRILEFLKANVSRFNNSGYIVFNFNANGVPGLYNGSYVYGFMAGTGVYSGGKIYASLIYTTYNRANEAAQSSVVISADNFTEFFEPLAKSVNVLPAEGVSRSSIIVAPYIDAYNSTSADNRSLTEQAKTYINKIWSLYGNSAKSKGIIGSASFGNYGIVIGNMQVGPPSSGDLPQYCSFVYISYQSGIMYFGVYNSTFFLQKATLTNA